MSDSQRRRRSAIQNGAVGAAPLAVCAKIDPAAGADTVKAAFEAVLDRHPMSRIEISETTGEPVQHFRQPGPLPFRENDAASWSAADLESRLASRARAPFDFPAEFPVRLDWFEGADGSRTALLCLHPLISDESSAVLVFEDLLEALQSDDESGAPRRRDDEPKFNFGDFVHWEAGLRHDESSRRRTTYWMEELEGAPAEISWPDCPEPGELTDGRSVYSFRLDDELAHELPVFSAEQNSSISAALLTAFQILIHRFTRQDEILIGVTSPGRHHSAFNAVAGPFATSMPLPSRSGGDLSFGKLLEETAASSSRARIYLPIPISELTESLDGSCDPGEWPFHRIEFSMLEMPGIRGNNLTPMLMGKSGHAVRFGGLTVESVDVAAPRSAADLKLSVTESDGAIFGCWDYDSERFSLETIERLNERFAEILTRAARDPDQPISRLFSFPGNEPAPASDNSPRRIRFRRSGSPSRIDFEAEAQLDPDIVPPGELSPVARPPARLLLTGATGFVGAFLLDELLRRTDAEVHCLGRADSDSESGVMERLRSNLAQYDLDPKGFDRRVHPVAGDLARPLLGLTEQRFGELAREIDVIYHNAADVNLVLPYQALRAVNVDGTREILRLACCGERAKPVHVVSTITAQTTAENRGEIVTEDDPLPPCDSLLYGYSQTKWVAETMIEEARRRGLPVSIYRPGHVTGDSRTGASNTGDLLHSLLLVCWQLGSAPLRDAEFDVTPVDYVARALVELSLRNEALGGTFHLTNPEPLQTREFAEWMNDLGLGVDAVSYDLWRRQLLDFAEQTDSNEIRPLVEILAPRALGDDSATAVHPRFNCDRAAALLSNADILCPPADTALFSTYLQYLRARRTSSVPSVVEVIS